MPFQFCHSQQHLLYRRQYVLGPRYINDFPDWKTVELGDALFLSAHPDLEVARAQGPDGSVTLLGIVVDPEAPLASGAEIAQTLCACLEKSKDLKAFLPATGLLGGRWVMIAEMAGRSFVVPDAAGQRSIHYAKEERGAWCANQPQMLARLLGLEKDPEAVAFWEGSAKDHDRFWWPGNRTLYRRVRRLLPNHYLDLTDGTVHRFWPAKPLEPRRAEQVVARCAELLRALMEASINRYHVALAVTAGGDTRTLLAAARPRVRELFLHTRRQYELTRFSPDIRVPRRLLRKLGLRHAIIESPDPMDPEFKDLYDRSTDCPHRDCGSIVQGSYQGLPEDAVVVWGTVTVVQHPYPPPSEYPSPMTPEFLSRVVYREPCAFAIRAFADWLAEADFPPGYNILDLLYWEQRSGVWAAMINDEFDLAHETIPIYNCRELLDTTLAIGLEPRFGKAVPLYRALIERLWPETLQVPINPWSIEPRVRRFCHSAESALANALDRVGLYRFARRVKWTILRRGKHD